jgi:ribose transport system ATP-binding protein
LTAASSHAGETVGRGETTGPVVLSLSGISKRYGPVLANQDVTVEFRAGEVHAVVGENGSGKSTLLGIASGMVVPDEGEVVIGGEELTSASAKQAMSLGLGMAYQTLSEVFGLTVAENLYLATPHELRPPYGQMESWAAEKVAEYGLDIKTSVYTEKLPLSQRQMLEVVVALLADTKVLLLDEPTTALGINEVEWLHDLIREVAAKGVGVIYVSHRLPEVLGVADRVTVLRDGISQGTFEAKTMAEADVVALMIGRPLDMVFPEGPEVLHHDVVLEISQLQGRQFGPIDLEVRRGEILGVGGAEGNGQVSLLRALAGAEPSNGTVRCAGRRVNLGNPPGPLRAGIVLLSSDRKAESIFTALGVRANATLQVLKRFSRFGWVFRSKERRPVDDLVRRLSLKAASIEQPAQYLSGGNQQKVALMRPFLKADLNVILADEPTQGVDVGARLDIYDALRQRAAEGVAVVVKSSDHIELSGLCDRVIVMSRGRIVDEIAKADLNEQRIISAIVGGTSGHGSDDDN